MHYFLENQPPDVAERARRGKLTGPEFVGQGCTERVGSDSYGYYVAGILKPGRLAAIADADSDWVTDWTGGEMTAEFPGARLLKAEIAGDADRELTYIMRYGGGWYRCERGADGAVKRIPGAKIRLAWNGAYAYRDPSFYFKNEKTETWGAEHT